MTTSYTAVQKTLALPDSPGKSRQRLQNTFFSAVVFLSFALIFSFLRSNDIFGVDGAFRCLEVFRRQSIFFHENNHLLYPVNVLAWTRLLSALGFTASNRQHFYSQAELMNCIAAAAAVAIVFSLTRSATRSTSVAIGVAIGLGFSRAFLAHATNSAEPMAGVFWSFLAVGVAALSIGTGRTWPIIASAVLFALAMATYHSMIFLAPAAIIVAGHGQTGSRVEPLFSRQRLVALTLFALTGLGGSALIYGWAFSRVGITRPSEMLKSFFLQRYTRVFFGLEAGKLLNVPIGLVRNLFHLQPQYTGIRNLLAGPKLSMILFLLIVAAICATLFIYAALAIRRWSRVPAVSRTAFMAAGAGALFTSIPVVLGIPDYDKFWLQPLACLAVLLGISISVTAPTEKGSFNLSKVIPVILLAGVLSNLSWAAKSHKTAYPYLSETERLSHIIGKSDLLVGEWDTLTTLYGYGWTAEQVFSFPTEAVVHGPRAVQALHERVIETHKAGGKIYFLALLDVPPGVWDSFLGSRCGVPYSEMDFYRAHAAVRVATFQNGSESTEDLRRLDLLEQ